MRIVTPMDFFYSLIKGKHTAPRWIIFVLDVCICIFALGYANLLRFNFDLNSIAEHFFLVQLIVVTAINISGFLLFGTYKGIIRMSSLKEGVRCISAVSASFFCLVLMNIISGIYNLPNIVPTSVLIIYFFTASFIIFGYRVLAKDLYHRSIKSRYLLENVMVFGGTVNGTLIKKAIEHIKGGKFKVIGFIEPDNKYYNHSIENTRIYSFDHIKKLAKFWDVKIVFLASDLMDFGLKNEVVEFFLSKKIEVKILPPVQSWVDGQLQNKQIQNIKIEDLLNRPAIKLATTHVTEYLQDKRVLITGAAGSIGSEITRQIVRMNPPMVILCDNSETPLYEIEYELLKEHGINTNIKIVIADITDPDSMKHLFKAYRPEVVFHAAAYKHVPMMEKNPSEAIKNNVLGTKIVADLSRQFRAERFVLISTDKAINPSNVMGASKRVAELYIRGLQHSYNKFGVNITGQYVAVHSNEEKEAIQTKYITTRFGNVLGSNGSVIPRFREQIERGGPVTVTDPNIIRYFMTIPEASSLVLEACTMGNGGEIFLFDMGEPVRIADLAHKMIKLSGLIPGKDIKIEYTGLRPGEKLFEELLNKEEEVIPTHHKKIMISRTSEGDYEELEENIQNLLKLAQQKEHYEVVKQMKYIVPEYKSNNSIYEALDNEAVKQVI
jgi:FlaA1/EpsC-like NDP-sugar epimerase